jgi:DNA-binding GntR family transcriptional regulator
METELSQLRPLNVVNLRNRIEEQIRSAMLQGTFRPGERLVETTIAEQLGVSRAPVREALAALEREGIVVHVPRRGYFVVDFTDKDIEEIYSLRLMLELGALRRAETRISPEDIDGMQQILFDWEKAYEEESASEDIVALDLSFHGMICLAADHSRLYQAWYSMRTQTRVLMGLTSRTHYDQPNQPKELHQLILDSIREDDWNCAKENLTHHILDAQCRATTALSELRSNDREEPV